MDQAAPPRISNKRDLIAAIGRPAVMEGMGISTQAITEALRGDKGLPANWFLFCRDKLAEQGLDCPEALFAFGPRGQR